MKRVINLITIMVFIAIMSSSCSMQEGGKALMEPETLELSQYALELPSESQEVTPLLTVTTNQQIVKVQSLAPDWLEAQYRNKTIYISAKPNNSGEKRETSLLVFAGTKFEVVKVVQMGSALYLELSETEMVVPAEGKTLIVDVRSNGGEWNYEIDESAEDWINVTRIDNFLQLSIAPNTNSSEREGQIYVQVKGTNPKELSITQQAFNNGARFGLPLLKKSPTKHEIIEYEKKQGSFVVKYVDSELGEPIDIPYVVFLYASPVFQSVTYSITAATKSIHQIVMISDDAKTLKSDEFKQTLIDKGFEIKVQKGSDNYTGTSTSTGFDVEVVVNELKDSKVIFTPIKG